MVIQDIQWTEQNSQFGYHEINHHASDGDDHNKMELEFETIDLKITLRGKSKINQSTGLTLWTCAQILCGYLIDNPQFVEGKRVLELGAGLGLCGMIAHNLKAERVVATDGDVTVLENLRYNYKFNHFNIETNDDGHGSTTSIACPQLVWGKDLDVFKAEYGRFSVIIGADLFYTESSIQPAWETIDALLEPDGVFLLSFCPHKLTIDQILDKAKELGFTWTKPSIVEGSDEDVDEEHLLSLSIGYHVFVFRREDP